MKLSVVGIQGEQKKNVLAYLGAVPESDENRRNFVVSARDKVESALQALGYYQPEIEIDLQRTEPKWRLSIVVNAGEPVRVRDINIQILGAAANDDNFTRLTSDIGFSSGDVLHHGRFESFRKKVLSLGQRRGYLRGEIVASRIEIEVDAGTADVMLWYESGPRLRFGEIIVDNTLIDSDLFDSMLTFQPGDYFDQVRLQELQSRLQRTNYFSSVIVLPQRKRSLGDRIPIMVNLQRAKRHSFDVGVGYSTDTEERLSLTWRTPRINRHGHSQQTRLVYSPINPSGRFTYSIPVSDPLTDVVQLWARVEENEFGDIDSRQNELGIKRETKNRNWIYGYSLRELNESWDIAGYSASNDYLLFGGSVSRRTHRGSIVDPEGGFSQLYTVEATADQLGSDLDLLRVTAALRYVMTPVPRNRLVTRLDLGRVKIANGDRRDLAPSLAFFAGGSQSIRGYAYQSLGDELTVVEPNGETKTLVVGGDRLVIGSLEYQYYFTATWRGALFVDAGDAFDRGEFDAKVGAGFGVHYVTPVGAVRVELANSVSEDDPSWRLVFAIGAEF
ncbi:autotransporter assembly complex protein TamA [Halioglobus sp. Uisw_031]|uniref:autotransporter assembly complex protein TamA n=1 Tax=Halioglobus sp. Uisw_031 TaxID=3230977 RepID=UPI0039EBA210